MTTGRANRKSGGRRRNYASADEREGIRSRLPTGWANWLGFVLFGFCGVAVLVAAVFYTAEGDYADAIVAAALGCALAYMVYLFGTTRLRV